MFQKLKRWWNSLDEFEQLVLQITVSAGVIYPVMTILVLTLVM